MEHGCDVLACNFRPDGLEICCTATNGNIYIWDVETATQVGLLEGRRDITGGRLSTDAMTVENSSRSKYFNSVAYSADGSCILAGGRSKYVCIYAVASGVLVKKFQLSHNRSLEGILDELRSDQLVDGVVASQLPSLEPAVGRQVGKLHSQLPGTKSSSSNSRTLLELTTSALKFSPTGREWVVATSSQGLQVFSLDDQLIFAPFNLDIAITPASVKEAIGRHDYGLAINIALHLGEHMVLKEAVQSIALADLELVVKSIDLHMLREMIKFITEQINKSIHLEYYLRWSQCLLREYGEILRNNHGQLKHIATSQMAIVESLRSLLRVITSHEKEVLRMTEENYYSLDFLCSQFLGDAEEHTVRGKSTSTSSTKGGVRGDECTGEDEEEEGYDAMVQEEKQPGEISLSSNWVDE